MNYMIVSMIQKNGYVISKNYIQTFNTIMFLVEIMFKKQYQSDDLFFKQYWNAWNMLTSTPNN